jgi:hypothetical protein
VPERVLSPAELNRATLARQLLLKRERLDPVEAIERLVALQAQEPASPYVALATRLDGFRAEQLDEAFTSRRVVKATLLRVTLHAVSARDYRRFWPAVRPALKAWRDQGLRSLRIEVAVDQLGRKALAYATEARTNQELAAHLGPMDGQVGPAGQTDAWWAVRPYLPMIMTPSDVPWSFGRRPAYVAAETWLGEPLVDEESGLDHLVRRYLAAFGPATVGDIATFTKIARSRLKSALERLRPGLRTFRDERRRLLHDVPDAPLPPADTPPPPRLLAMWDSVLIAYEDRSRVIPDEIRSRVIMKNGDFLPSVLVDGHVAGLWRSEVVDGRTRIHVEPFDTIPRSVEKEVDREAEQMAAFVERVEPNVYKRYATTWMTRARAGA